MIVVLNAGAPT